MVAKRSVMDQILPAELPQLSSNHVMLKTQTVRLGTLNNLNYNPLTQCPMNFTIAMTNVPQAKLPHLDTGLFTLAMLTAPMKTFKLLY
jgi:hypothetical protein